MSCRLMWVAALLTFILSPAAFAAEKPLDARQEQLLKEAADFITQAEGVVSAMEKASSDWKAGDPAVPRDQVMIQIKEREKAVRYLNNAGPRFARLPGKHLKVAPEIMRYDAATKSLAAVEAKLLEIQRGFAGMVKQEQAPEYKVDFDRLKEIYRMYANPNALRDAPAAAVETAKQIGAAKAERDRIAAKYAPMLKQSTPEAAQMRQVLASSAEIFAAYDKAIADFIAAAPGDIEKAADEVLATAKEGVEKNKPGYFGEKSGLKSRLARAEEHLNALATLAPGAEGTKLARAKLESTQATIEQMGAAFLEATVASNTTPPDKFAGPEREALLQMLTAKWAKEGNGAAVLKVGVIGPDWQRQTKMVWNDSITAWEKVDKSRLQGFVVAKLNDAQAAVWPINFVKDHLAGDAIGAYFLFDVKKEPGVGSRVLLTNVK